LKHFSIDRDRADVLPILRIALQKAPHPVFFAAVWSPPGWMKTSGTLCGGKIDSKLFPSLARCFARFIEACAAAFHHYEGKPSAMTTLSNQFPGKHVYFTEGSVFGVEGAAQIVEVPAPRRRQHKTPTAFYSFVVPASCRSNSCTDFGDSTLEWIDVGPDRFLHPTGSGFVII
jgi:O-glycosyl hydrolase